MTGLRISARQVPAMVAAHQDYLRGAHYEGFAGNFFRKALQISAEENPHGPQWTQQDADDYGRAWCAAERDRLNIAPLFHVTESMTEVAKFAARKLDGTERITLDILPSRCGVLVFERPVHMLDAWLRRMTISAVTWYVDDAGDIAFNHYTDVTDTDDAYNQVLQASGSLAQLQMGRWSLAHVGGCRERLGPWLESESEVMKRYRDTHVDAAAIDEEVFGLQQSSETLVGLVPLFANFSHVLFSIFSLMDQTIVELTQEHDRRSARRWAGKRRPPTMVTVIALRRKEYHGYHEEGTGTWLTYRSITRGHWRQQPYGPGRQSVKRIWINAYCRGPEDAPFFQPQRVSTLAR